MRRFIGCLLILLVAAVASCSSDKPTLTDTALEGQLPSQSDIRSLDEIDGTLSFGAVPSRHQINLSGRRLSLIHVVPVDSTTDGITLDLGTTAGQPTRDDSSEKFQEGSGTVNHAKGSTLWNIGWESQGVAHQLGFTSRAPGKPTWMLLETATSGFEVVVGPGWKEFVGTIGYRLTVASCMIEAPPPPKKKVIERRLDEAQLREPVMDALRCLFGESKISTLVQEDHAAALFVMTAEGVNPESYRLPDCPQAPGAGSLWVRSLEDDGTEFGGLIDQYARVTTSGLELGDPGRELEDPELWSNASVVGEAFQCGPILAVGQTVFKRVEG